MAIQMRLAQVPQGLRSRTLWPWFPLPRSGSAIAKLKAKNKSMTEESPEKVAKAAKFQHIIEKIKSQHEADLERCRSTPHPSASPRTPRKRRLLTLKPNH